MKKFTTVLLLLLGITSLGFAQTRSCIDDGTRYVVYDALSDKSYGCWMPDFYGPGTGISHFSFEVEGYETYLDVLNDGTAHLHGVVSHGNKPFEHNGELWGIDVWFDPNPGGTPKNSTDPIPPEIMDTWDLYILRDSSKMWLLADPTIETILLHKEDFPFGFQIGQFASLYDHLCDGCYELGASTWMDFSNQWNEGRVSSALHMTLNECIPDDCELGHRTQTPGGWGAKPSGNNPGTYLHANFDGAFPSGLVVGCDYTITLNSAQAITDFLPSGGKPAALTMNYVDPDFKINTLAGHAVALTLAIGFDSYDPDFGSSGSSLGSLVATSGTFSGWTASEILAEANKVLGGCNSPYSASQLTDALTSINENFVDGFITGSYLNCPDVALSTDLVAYPNPFEFTLTLSLTDLPQETIEYKIMNSYGEVKLKGATALDGNGKASLDVSSLDQGGYIVSVIAGNSVRTVLVIKN